MRKLRIFLWQTLLNALHVRGVLLRRVGLFIKWSRTGPDRTEDRGRPDRTGPRSFGLVLGPVLFCFRSSVRSRFGPGGPANGPNRIDCCCSPLNTPSHSNSLCSLVCANTGQRPVASGVAFQLVKPGGMLGFGYCINLGFLFEIIVYLGFLIWRFSRSTRIHFAL
ncbi:hypothetical protein Cgig2_013070 [Carnegiea gigantea]|uniref:Uncharacterized protein n=1 Tax=Carnegiea gigantea TaxID=171969 RepID=A0A9Q1KPP3_9CARY|nr:hypothetical protein Cgig2_013070 [Carnegiea gigantea]